MSPSAYPAIVADFLPRRLLLHVSSSSTIPTTAPTTTEGTFGDGVGTFDGNAIMILAIILCALVSALLLNTIVQCAIRCSRRTDDEGDTVDKHSSQVRRKALRILPLITYSAELKLPGAAGGECAICFSEFVVGDRIRVLPECNHGFHVPCVDRWLLVRPSCPTCRRCLLSSCQKVSICGEGSLPGTAQSVIAPLEPEGLLLGRLL